MKNRNLITKYLILILPLLFMSLNAQDDLDPVEAASQAKAVAEAAEADAATEEAATTPEGEETATEEAATPRVKKLQQEKLVKPLLLKKLLTLWQQLLKVNLIHWI